MRANSLLIAIACIALAFPRMAAADLIYFNDGTIDDFDDRAGDTAISIPFNSFFAPGGFMNGTPDDMPPVNEIGNPGLVTLQGAAGGVAGGVFRKQVNNPRGAVQGGGVVTYGSLGRRKATAGANWEANIRVLYQQSGLDPRDTGTIWNVEVAEKVAEATGVKIVKYTGDPLVSVPPEDLSPSAFDPLDTAALSAYLADNPNAVPFFWEVTGNRDLGAIDFLLGDLGLNSGYTDLAHHFPMVALFSGAGPSDLGLDPMTTPTLRIDGSSVSGTGPITVGIGFAVSDPVVPEPSSLTLLGVGILGLLGYNHCRRKGWRGGRRVE